MYAHTVIMTGEGAGFRTHKEARMPRIRTLRSVAITGVAAIALSTAACTITPATQTNDLGADTVLVAADNGSPTFEQVFSPFSASKRIGSNFVYEPLEVINTLDGTETPFLATGHTIVDTSTVDFDIRSGVNWSDGTPFTADDVAYTFQLIKDVPALDTRGVWQEVASVSVEGSKVRFTLKEPDATAARLIEQQLIVPEHIWSKVDDPATFTDPTPIGTGPYVEGDFTKNQYTMVKNDKYWQADKVAIENLTFPASNTQIDLVKKGYDWGYGYISDVDNTWVAADKQHNSYWFPPGGVIALYPNLTKAPFDNVDFRLGLSSALDRDSIADSAVEGYVSGAVQTGLLLPNMQASVDPDIPDKGIVKQDTAAAESHFEAAGYTLTNGKLVDSSGKQVTVNITTANGYTDWLRAVQAVQKQLGAVGIAVNIQQPQPAAYTAALQTGDFDLAMGTFGGSGFVYDDFNTLLGSSFAKPIGTATTGNYERYSDSTVDSLLAKLKVSTDAAEQQDIANQLQKVMYDTVPAIAMYYGGLWGLYSDAKFTGWPSADDPYAAPKVWDSTVLLVVTHVTKAQ
jgi:peptide/nickel transport system substrate-binding protein